MFCLHVQYSFFYLLSSLSGFGVGGGVDVGRVWGCSSLSGFGVMDG